MWLREGMQEEEETTQRGRSRPGKGPQEPRPRERRGAGRSGRAPPPSGAFRDRRSCPWECVWRGEGGVPPAGLLWGSLAPLQGPWNSILTVYTSQSQVATPQSSGLNTSLFTPFPSEACLPVRWCTSLEHWSWGGGASPRGRAGPFSGGCQSHFGGRPAQRLTSRTWSKVESL